VLLPGKLSQRQLALDTRVSLPREHYASLLPQHFGVDAGVKTRHVREETDRHIQRVSQSLSRRRLKKRTRPGQSKAHPIRLREKSGDQRSD
jgi:hypothetical protein